jgi:hypothetical protein
VASVLVGNVDDFSEVAPAQLSRQCRDNSIVRKIVGELHHPEEVRPTPTPPEPLGELPCEPTDYSFPVRRSRPVQNILTDALADAPIQHYELTVDCDRRARPGSLDQPCHIAEQRFIAWGLDPQLLDHRQPLVLCTQSRERRE